MQSITRFFRGAGPMGVLVLLDNVVRQKFLPKQELVLPRLERSVRRAAEDEMGTVTP